MINQHNWQLPEGIDEQLPPEAERGEMLRRKLLDLYRSWGYEFVSTPFVEYLDSLLTGTGSDLDLQTYKITDQLSGRTMGLRADITPQIARIDAHKLRLNRPTRFCYIGTVLRTREAGQGTRNPVQVGCELFGHDGVESDAEIILLMLETIAAAGVKHQHVDLGHVGIYRTLVKQSGLAKEQEMELFEALQRKATNDIAQLVNRYELTDIERDQFLKLASLNGESAVLDQARAYFKAYDQVLKDIDYLSRVAAEVQHYQPDLCIHYDLAELRSYHYKTGVVFAAFAAGSGAEIARGGRYNNIGHSFGRARPATGFSAYLKVMLRAAETHQQIDTDTILAPRRNEQALLDKIEALRMQGQKVIWELPGYSDPQEMNCTAVLAQDESGKWIVVPI